MRKAFHLLLLFFLLTSAISLAASEKNTKATCPMVKLDIKRLPDLSIPRAGHQTLFINGELVVIGGHTNAFVPTPTAEYFSDNQWHQVKMFYNHDNAVSVMLAPESESKEEQGGKRVLIAGGSEQAIGIGQTYLAEIYDAQNHTFNTSFCLDMKRTLASATALDSGKVVIAGNWYHRDGIEIYDGDKDFKYLKDVSVQRSSPYIFRIAKDDAIIFGSLGIKGDTVFSAVADRVKGDSIHIPLFETWHPLQSIFNHSARCFIGDESKELYTYLLAVKDSSGQVAIAKVENGAFSLLPTDVPVPMESQWEKIEYCTSIIADTKRGKAYLIGSGSSFLTKKDKPLRRYILCIDYANAANGGAATLKLFYTEPMSDTPEVPVLDDDGNLLTAGGMLGRSNFTPSPYVYQMFVAGQPIAEEKGSNWLVTGLIIILVTQILIAFLVIYMRRKRQKRQKPVTVITGNSYSESDESNDLMAYNMDTTSAGVSDKQLMAIIAEAMEVNKLYLRADLKVSDIAEAIGARRNDVSACINSTLNCTVSQFINNYRIEYAKQLLLKNPTKKISSVWMESGFSNEQTFFRTFRASTGKSPKEWISQKID